MFTNPLISRLRLKNFISLNALSHENNGNVENQQKDKTKPVINLGLLLKKKENLLEGGPGVSLLLSMSLKDIMVRWINYMIERAIYKLEPIIDILKKELGK